MTQLIENLNHRMKNKDSQHLINGTFEKKDAIEILSNLFASKIKYHTLAAFSQEERNNSKISIHDKRKTELTKSLDKIMKSINKKSNQNSNVEIECLVKLKFIKKTVKRKNN